ncbi:unnamed protein product [Ranitomeya imitator]|uniref:Uncharacterized protein n=1 Tax=Ranitomeya imitator TaxID=111125 RepID=A0ABN9LW18_9NEOB|nr:unnamed protein product [Ranitomeya imitator]
MNPVYSPVQPGAPYGNQKKHDLHRLPRWIPHNAPAYNPNMYAASSPGYAPGQTKYACAGAVAEDQKRTSWNEDGRRRSGPETPIRPDQQRDRPWVTSGAYLQHYRML